MGQISYKNELLRKSIHMASLSIPISYYFLTQQQALYILIPLTLLAVLFDFGRHHIQPIGKLYNLLFKNILREKEQKGLSGAAPLMISACICIAFFPKIIAITAMAVLVICDTAAALIGRRWGRIKFLDKSLEGSIAFIISGLVVLYFINTLPQTPDNFIINGTIALTISAIIEAFSKKMQIDDNYSIPLTFCVVMSVLTL